MKYKLKTTANAFSENSFFNSSKLTKIVVHGYRMTKRLMIKETIPAFLKYGDFNVVWVDWEAGAQPPYHQAVANARVVGLEIATFIYNLNYFFKIKLNDIHCIGYSLGAHVCGYAGEKFDKIGRITGIDPAGLLFTNTPKFVRLDPSDALFVDVIHTSGHPNHLGLGTAQPMGNIDFYINNGYYQPGCSTLDLTCHHRRSIQIFLETLKNKKCSLLAHECLNYEMFATGRCSSCRADNSACAIVGMRADEYVAKQRRGVTMFINTNAQAPYCGYEYSIKFLTGKRFASLTNVVGSIVVSMYGDQGHAENIEISSDHENIELGMVKLLLFFSSIDIGNVYQIRVLWKYNSVFYDPGTYCISPFCNRHLYIKSIKVSPMNYYPESKRLRHTVVLCHWDGRLAEIRDEKAQNFFRSKSCQLFD